MSFRSDLQHAARLLWRDPGLTAVVTLTLAVAIGANTALFSVVDAVLLQPLPYSEPERLVRVHATHPKVMRSPLSPADFFDYRSQNRTFESIAMLYFFEHEYLGSAGPEQLRGYYVSRGYFELLGYHPALGASYGAGREGTSESYQDLRETVILSHRFWRDRLGSDPNVIGKAIHLSRRPFEVIGVMPEGLRHIGDSNSPHSDSVDFWMPTELQPERLERGARMYEAVGKLKLGVSVNQAQADLTRIAQLLERDHPRTNKGWRASVRPLREEIVGRAEPMLLLSWGAAAFVLLIACANLTCLLLARSAARAREYALRAALGASGAQLLRFSLIEAAVLAAGGTALGLPVAIAGIKALVWLAPENLPRRDMISVDSSMLAFAAVLTPLTALLFGLLPALRTRRADPGEQLRVGGRTVSAGGSRWFEGLIVLELALCVVVLTGAGLLARTLFNIQQAPSGVRPAGTMLATIDIPGNVYGAPDKRRQFYGNILGDLRARPDVEHAGVSTFRPFTSNVTFAMNTDGMPFEVIGTPVNPNEAPRARLHSASPGYFEAIGTRLIDGRWFSDRDEAGSPPVVLVNETLARRYFHGSSALGKSLRLGGRRVAASVVGIVADIKDSPASAGAEAYIFAPYAQLPAFRVTAAVKTRGEAERALPALRQILARLDPNVPVFDAMSLQTVTDHATSAQRFAAVLFTAFATVALLLSIVGSYGVMEFLTRRRTREFAIRQALGASAQEITAMVVRRALLISAAGVLLGLAGSPVLTRGLEAVLFGVRADDWATRATAGLILTAAVLYAAAVPAWRGGRVDPASTLKAD